MMPRIPNMRHQAGRPDRAIVRTDWAGLRSGKRDESASSGFVSCLSVRSFGLVAQWCACHDGLGDFDGSIACDTRCQHHWQQGVFESLAVRVWFH